MLKLSETLYAALRQHGEQTYPHECCGVLLGSSSDGVHHVQDVVRAGNTRTDSAHNRYQISPQELIRIQRQGRERGLDIVGFYHSHPDHPARWSPTDYAEAHWLGCSYVITAVAAGQATQTNAFLLAGSTEEDKAFVPQPVVLEGADAALADSGEPATPGSSATAGRR
ncbi:MAG TPA: M67 family metallopeptidase [Acidobacteriaceae bacterium]